VPGKGYAAVVETFPVTQLTSVSDRISALGKQRCGRLSARMGRYKYFTSTDNRGRAVLTQYRQSFSCYDPATDPYQRAPADWKPSAQDQGPTSPPSPSATWACSTAATISPAYR
jgi:hypothetical protein